MQQNRPSANHKALLVYISALLILSGCASLQPGYDPPTVSVTSFGAEPGEGIAPHFKISLRIVNPNNTALTLKGAAYTVSLEGYETLSGATNDLPTIDAYSEGNVTISAQADLLDSIRLFNSLTKEPRDSFAYELKTKLDTGNFMNPIRVTDSGTISFGTSLN